MPLSDYDTIINQAADEWNLDPKYLRAVLMQENAKGDPRAVSGAGAIGLGQLMPSTAKMLGVTDPTDPVQSIYGAAKYLDTALTAEGTPEGAALYYHGGPGWRQNFGPESQGYVPGVAKNYASLTPPPANTAASTQPTRIQVASATPKTATDAAPGGDDPLSLLPPAPKASSTPPASAPAPAVTTGNGKAAPAANDGDPLKLLPPAPKPVPAATPATPYDVNPEAIQDPNASIATLGPTATGTLRNALEPTPGTWYGDVMPVAQTPEEAKANTFHFAMPNILRSPLLGLTTPISEAGTVDPIKGTYGADPNMVAGALMIPGAANPLQFSRELPSMLPSFAKNVPPRAITVPKDLPYITPDMSPSEMALATQAQNRLAAGVEQPRPVRLGGPDEERTPLIPQAQPPTPGGGGTPMTLPEPTRAALRQLGFHDADIDALTPSDAAAFIKQGKSVGPSTQPTTAQPAGAQITPSYEAIYTPKEEAAYRATAEGQKLLEPQVIGERDNNSYIPGVTPNQAEIEQTVEAARDMKALGIQTPEASQLAKETAQAIDTTRKEYSLNTEKTPVDITNEETAREADINRDAAKVFADGNVQGDVSTQPLIDQMRGEMNLRRNRQNSALQSVYGDLIKRLTGEDGNAVTMHPEEAWSLRQDIDRMTDKLSTTGTDAQARNQRRVAGNLNGVSDTLDGLIEDQAPGYGDMLKTYKAHSDKIREMEVLQGLTSRISTGPQGNLSFSAMQRFMKNVVDSRATGSQDLNPYKSISPETMQRLWNLRDDLRRSAGASELARAAGSDTTQNILDVMRNWGKLAGQSAAHAGALHYFGPAGPVALRMMQEAIAPYRIARRTQRNISAMQQMLNPPTPLRIPPGQENPLAQP